MPEEEIVEDPLRSGKVQPVLSPSAMEPDQPPPAEPEEFESGPGGISLEEATQRASAPQAAPTPASPGQPGPSPPGQQSPPKLRVLNALGEDITNKPQSQVQQRDEWGRPTGPPPGADDGSMMPLAQFQAYANRAVPQVQVTPGMTREQYQHQLLERSKHVDSLVHQMTTNHMRERQHASDMAAKAEDHKEMARARREQYAANQEAVSKENRIKQQERLDLRKNGGLNAEQVVKLHQHHEDAVEKNYRAAVKASKDLANPVPVPAEISTPEKREALVQGRIGKAMDRLRQQQGEQAEKPAGGKPGGETPPSDQGKGYDAVADSILKRAGVAADAGMSHIDKAKVAGLAEMGVNAWNAIPRWQRGEQTADFGRLVDHLLAVHKEGIGMSAKKYERYKELLGKVPPDIAKHFTVPEPRK
jgi:hypothetical protein